MKIILILVLITSNFIIAHGQTKAKPSPRVVQTAPAYTVRGAATRFRQLAAKFGNNWKFWFVADANGETIDYYVNENAFSLGGNIYGWSKTYNNTSQINSYHEFLGSCRERKFTLYPYGIGNSGKTFVVVAIPEKDRTTKPEKESPVGEYLDKKCRQIANDQGGQKISERANFIRRGALK